jgi:hypothetical protein
LNIFEKREYRRILGPVYDNEKENWWLLTNKEVYEIVENPTITETIRLHRLLVWTCTENGRKQNSQNSILY